MRTIMVRLNMPTPIIRIDVKSVQMRAERLHRLKVLYEGGTGLERVVFEGAGFAGDFGGFGGGYGV